MTTTVYGLVDANTLEIRYVGITVALTGRLYGSEHAERTRQGMAAVKESFGEKMRSPEHREKQRQLNLARSAKKKESV